LRKKDNPLDASNRRITLIVQYIVKDAGEESPLEQGCSRKRKTRTCARQARMISTGGERWKCLQLCGPPR
jgi:hypothetical protein